MGISETRFEKLDEEEWSRHQELQQKPCVACGTIPASGVYHGTVPCCIDCYWNGWLEVVLTSEMLNQTGVGEND